MTQGNADVTCVEPQKMLREVFSHRAPPYGPRQLAVNLLDDGDGTRCAEEVKRKNFELVLSVEVAEHIPVELHENLAQILAGATGKYLVFSAGREGQGGTGHLPGSGKPKEEWISAFEKQGLVHMPHVSMLARQSSYPERSYDLFGNLIVMRNPQFVGEDEDKSLPADDIWSPNYFPYAVKEYHIRKRKPGDKDVRVSVLPPKGNDGERIEIHKIYQTKYGHSKPINFNQRVEFWYGMEVALFPELTLLERKIKAGEYTCAKK